MGNRIACVRFAWAVCSVLAKFLALRRGEPNPAVCGTCVPVCRHCKQADKYWAAAVSCWKKWENTWNYLALLHRMLNRILHRMLNRILAAFQWCGFFFTISIDSAGSARSQIPSVWCQFSPSVRGVPKISGWTQTWQRRMSLDAWEYNCIVPLQKQREDCGNFDGLLNTVLSNQCTIYNM